ncbi:hypothetical protein D8674_037467 [Pyrus ussuriensis x Pyrus communis]|uniref:Uncharacterized protein n=1 Tax=Pyrus ussuriensis x Pyrus communis TaxID=2448454 RepID=A0A5N5H156_9ROSA|nr:hypothetical protein D8674_037467 [Pyrus ussuriensis x Pyrus communis]
MADSGTRLSKTTNGKGSGKDLPRTKCSADWKYWRAIPDELKMHMIDELAATDNAFKSRFREWKFDNECTAALQQEPEVPADV